MKTKSVAALIVVTILAASPFCRVNAQSATPAATAPSISGEGRHEHRNLDPEKRLEHMTKRLDLTQQQQVQILPVLQQEAQTIKSLKDNATLTGEQKKAQIRESLKSTHKQILAFLTPEQQQKLREMRHHHPKHGQESGTPATSTVAPTPAVQ
jgi:Spy/CpxP family protein refolding chaperone